MTSSSISAAVMSKTLAAGGDSCQLTPSDLPDGAGEGLPPTAIKTEPVDNDTLNKRRLLMEARSRLLADISCKWDALSVELCLLTATGDTGAKILAAAGWRNRSALQVAAERRRLRLPDCSENMSMTASLQQQQRYGQLAGLSGDNTVQRAAISGDAGGKSDVEAASVTSATSVLSGRPAVSVSASTRQTSDTSVSVAGSVNSATHIPRKSTSDADLLGAERSQSSSSCEQRLSGEDSSRVLSKSIQPAALERPCHEAHVQLRIQQLRRQGLWSERRLPRVAEPRRRRSHWDCLLDEMQWMAADFAQERRWKIAAAHKCAAIVAAHFAGLRRDAAIAARKERARLRGLAASVAFIVRQFWANLRRVAEVRTSCAIEERIRRLYRHIELAENEALADPILAQLRQLHRESRLPLEQLLRSLPPAYVRTLSSDGGADTSVGGEDSQQNCDTDARASRLSGASVALSGRQQSDSNFAGGKADHRKPLVNSVGAESHSNDCLDEDNISNGAGSVDRVQSPTDLSDDDQLCHSPAAQLTCPLDGVDLSCLLSADDLSAESSSSTCDEASRSHARCDTAMTHIKQLRTAASTVRPRSLICPAACDCESPLLLRHSLRPYQHVGWRWLYEMQRRCFNALLADDAGLGKSAQLAALMAHLAAVDADWGRHLVVCSACDVLSWESELKKWCPALRVHVYSAEDCGKDECGSSACDHHALCSCHVCIVSYGRLFTDRALFVAIRWRLLILDDVQQLVGDTAAPWWRIFKPLHCRQRVLLSDASISGLIDATAADSQDCGTTDGDLQMQKVRELWRLTSLLFPSAVVDMDKADQLDSTHPVSIVRTRLGELLSDFTLRRRISQLTDQLPVVSDNVILCPLLDSQRQLYDRMASGPAVQHALTTRRFTDVMCALRQMRTVCNNPQLLVSSGTRSSSFCCDPIVQTLPSCVLNITAPDRQCQSVLSSIFTPSKFDSTLSAYVASRRRSLLPSRFQLAQQLLLERISPSPQCPAAAVTLPLAGGVLQRSSSNGVERDSNIVGNHVADQVDDGDVEEPALDGAALLSLLVGQMSAASAGGAAGLTLSRMACLAAPATVPQSRPPPSAPSPASVSGASGSTDAGRQQSPPPTPPPSPRPPITAAAAVAALSNYPFMTSQSAVLSSCEWADPVYFINERRCDEQPFYGPDLIDSLSVRLGTLQRRSQVNRVCALSAVSADQRSRPEPDDYTERISDHLLLVLDAFDCVSSRDLIVYVPAAVICGAQPQVEVTRPTAHYIKSSSIVADRLDGGSRLMQLTYNSLMRRKQCRRRFQQLHWLATARAGWWTPCRRQLPADCGKLQLLEQLLKQLKGGERRVLLLAQMDSVLDLLQRFLTENHFGYVRVDAMTPPHRRVVLLRRFALDHRLLCVLMATRTPLSDRFRQLAGVIDTVIVYDADWLPVADAHLPLAVCAAGAGGGVALARDVHIYRLVSERTVEENMVKCVDETRLARELLVRHCDRECIDRWRYRSALLRDLFGVDGAASGGTVDDDSVEMESAGLVDVSASMVEDALITAVEDGFDASSLLAWRASFLSRRTEFTSPALTVFCDNYDDKVADIPETYQLQRLTGVERWAVGRMLDCRDMLETMNCESLAGNFPEQKVGEAAKVALANQGHTSTHSVIADDHQITDGCDEWFHPVTAAAAEEMITYPGRDFSRVWISNDSQRTRLPVWSPPTPPRDDELDVYVDPTCNMLYSLSYMSEHQLPPVYVKKEPPKRKHQSVAAVAAAAAAAAAASSHQIPVTSSASSRSMGSGSSGDTSIRSKPLKVRREEGSVAPRSLFNRVPSSVLRMRRELNLQQRRTLFSTSGGGGAFGLPLSKMAAAVSGGPNSQLLNKASLLEYGAADWLVHEDWLLLQTLRCVLEMPLNLLSASPAHVVNWELVGELVNRIARSYRSPKFCRMRYDSAILPREEGKMIFSSPSKKSKKHKQQQLAAAALVGGGGALIQQQQQLSKASRPLRTSQMVACDKNDAFNQLLCQRFENMKAIANKRLPTTRPPALPAPAAAAAAALRVARHTSVLTDSGVEYNQPLTPAQIAVQRAARLTREKQRLVSSDHASRIQKPHATSVGVTANHLAVARVQTTPCTARIAVNSSSSGVAATVVSVANLTPVQVAQRLVSASGVVSAGGVSTSAAGKSTIQTLTQKSLTPSQLQALKQQTVLRHKLALAAASNSSASSVSTAAAQKVQVEVSGLCSTGVAAGSGVVTTVSSVGVSSTVGLQLAQTSARTQVRILKQPIGRHMVAARTMTESEMAVILKQRPQLAGSGSAVQTSLVPQLLAHVQSAGGAGGTGSPSSVTISLPRPVTPGAAKIATGRPILTQSVRKLATTGGSVMTGLGGVSTATAVSAVGAKRLPAQLSTVQLVQGGGGINQKQLTAGTVTVQQLQPVVGRLQAPGAAAVAVGEGGRLTTVTGVSSRQTIQVVTAPGSAGLRQPAAVQLLQPAAVSQSAAAGTTVTLAQLRPVFCATAATPGGNVATSVAISSSTAGVVVPRLYHQSSTPFVVTTAPAALLNCGLQTATTTTVTTGATSLPTTAIRVRAAASQVVVTSAAAIPSSSSTETSSEN